MLCALNCNNDTYDRLPCIRACLFDMDGLLIDSEDKYTMITNEVLQMYGRPMLPWSVKAQLQGRPQPEVCTCEACQQRQVLNTNIAFRPARSSMTGRNSLSRLRRLPPSRQHYRPNTFHNRSRCLESSLCCLSLCRHSPRISPCTWP